MSTDPSVEGSSDVRRRYCGTSEQLGFSFTYPAHYADSIAWAERDFDGGGDGHVLTFLRAEDIKAEQLIVGRISRRPLVPFARGANNDVLYCFDGVDPRIVLLIDLGEDRPVVRTAGEAGYLTFLNAYRFNEGLDAWDPTSVSSN